LNEYPTVDLCIDGADQVDSKLNLIKGKGGAHTREKIVASSSKKFFVIVDYRKLTKRLNIPVPVEVLEFSRTFVEEKLQELGGKPKLRENFVTDNGNVILDTKFEYIEHPRELELKLNEISGVIENGIFSRRKPEKVIIGHENGEVREIRKIEVD
jgi:ribose 5-phosphate isomerase A